MILTLQQAAVFVLFWLIHVAWIGLVIGLVTFCLLYTSPSPRDRTRSRMPSSA